MKVSQFIQKGRVVLLLVLLGVGIGCVGCGTPGDESENTSTRPWNSPEGWQNGAMPSMMQQPH